jgi:hypothetical protein
MTERLRQTGRFIYLLALFQLVAGPLVIGGVMLVGGYFQNGEITVSASGLVMNNDAASMTQAGQRGSAL